MNGAHMESVADLAIRTAIARRGVAHITIPVDVQVQESRRADPSETRVHHTSSRSRILRSSAARIELEHAADILNRGKKIAILAGQGALHATENWKRWRRFLARRSSRRCWAKQLCPMTALTPPAELACWAPSLRRTRSRAATPSYRRHLVPLYRVPARAGLGQVRADRDRSAAYQPPSSGRCWIGRRCQECACAHLMPQLKKHDQALSEEGAEGQGGMAEADGGARHPHRQADEASGCGMGTGQAYSGNAIVTSDSGTITTWWARYVPALRGQKHSCSGNLATMACGLPYAIAAAVAYPDRPVYCIIGDGGLSMLLGELITVAAYKLNIKIIVIKNNTLGQIKWEQMVFLGNPSTPSIYYPADFVDDRSGCWNRGHPYRRSRSSAARNWIGRRAARAGADRSRCRPIHSANAARRSRPRRP